VKYTLDDVSYALGREEKVADFVGVQVLQPRSDTLRDNEHIWASKIKWHNRM
jgi:hypothetical protein